jgi:hypothetical protein
MQPATDSHRTIRCFPRGRAAHPGGARLPRYPAPGRPAPLYRVSAGPTPAPTARPTRIRPQPNHRTPAKLTRSAAYVSTNIDEFSFCPLTKINKPLIMRSVCHITYRTRQENTVKRTTIYLTDEQKERLAFYSERTGAPVATLIRRAINESLAKLDTSPQPRDTATQK